MKTESILSGFLLLITISVCMTTIVNAESAKENKQTYSVTTYTEGTSNKYKFDIQSNEIIKKKDVLTFNSNGSINYHFKLNDKNELMPDFDYTEVLKYSTFVAPNDENDDENSYTDAQDSNTTIIEQPVYIAPTSHQTDYLPKPVQLRIGESKTFVWMIPDPKKCDKESCPDPDKDKSRVQVSITLKREA
jgi:hypothetical protein